MKSALLTMTLAFLSHTAAAQVMMPYCDFTGHEAQLIAAMKEKVEAETTKHFENTFISVESYDYGTFHTSGPASDTSGPAAVVYHFVGVMESFVHLSNGTTLVLGASLRMAGKVNADEVLPDGSLVNARCETHPLQDGRIWVMNAKNNVTIMTIDMSGIPIYSMP
jgi:hypothetical protein